MIKKDTALLHFKECLKIEVIDRSGKKPFSWLKVAHRVLFSKKKRFYFWWRFANFLYATQSRRNKSYARKIGTRLSEKYGADISVAAHIGKGMKINHYVGIIVRSECIIGENLNIRQNTTIGRKDSLSKDGMAIIGDNVDIGAHSCIIGDITIGNNVTIGAMSFINKDIPSDITVYTEKTNHLVVKPTK